MVAVNAARKKLESIYSVPHSILSRDTNTYRILVNNKEVMVSIEIFNPAFLWAPEISTTTSSTDTAISALLYSHSRDNFQCFTCDVLSSSQVQNCKLPSNPKTGRLTENICEFLIDIGGK
ncbi:hypothetical protein CDAR_613621 [Caerostris darwini]|uniref:Uncharacterized protein n=1 Tax=Caerostris darwini TaxID=1538125 RepID=A0AAV4RSI5_9ARAC|nr:hypothetical protein CDAR_613621 [Caerostris darwini]